jgi:hypothetical protein
VVLMRHALPVARADRQAASAESWDVVRTRTAVVAEGEKDVFEVARTLASYWPVIGAWK